MLQPTGNPGQRFIMGSLFWGIRLNTFFYSFSKQWLDKRGLNFTLVFSGTNKNDLWNSVSGKFILNN